MPENEETQPSPAENAGHTSGSPPASGGRPAAEGPATDGGSQAGPPSAPPGQPHGGYRQAPRLTRRTHDNVIGGVAGGIADYFGVDPLLVRLAFVGLALLGGGGVLLYVLGWIFIPARGAGEPTGVGPKADVAKWLGIALIVIAALVLVDGLGWAARGLGPLEHLFFATILIGLGVFLLRKEPAPAQGAIPTPPPPAGVPAQGDARDQATTPMTATEYTHAVPGASYPAPPPGYQAAGAHRRPRERSRLGLFTLAAVLLTTGAAALLNNLNVTSFDGGQLGALALAVLGGGLIVGAWWGRARWLIALGALMFPFVAFFSLIDLSNVSWEGHVGSTYWSPRSQEEVGGGYELLAGEMTVDLTDFEFAPEEPAQVDVDMTLGQLTVLVPRATYIEMDGSLEAGEINFFRTRRAGEGVSVVESHGNPDSRARLALNVEGAFGQIEILRASNRAQLQGPTSEQQEADPPRSQQPKKERP